MTETGAGGFVAVFPADAAAWPGNSSINWSAANSNVGNSVVTAVSADGKIKIRGGGSPTHPRDHRRARRHLLTRSS